MRYASFNTVYLLSKTRYKLFIMLLSSVWGIWSATTIALIQSDRRQWELQAW